MEGVLDLQSEHLQQTRSQIMALVAEIAAAARTQQNRHAFFSLALSRLRESMGAQGAAIWQLDNQSQWTVSASLMLPDELLASGDQTIATVSQTSPFTSTGEIESRLESIELMASEDYLNDPFAEDTNAVQTNTPSAAHAAILDVLQAEQQPTLVPPSTVLTANGRPPNPLPYCLVYAPIAIEATKTVFWLQAVVAPSGGPATHRGYLRFVVQIADLIGDFLRADQLRQLQREKGIFDAAQQILEDLDRVHMECGQTSNGARSLGESEEAVVAKSVMQWAQADEAFFVYQAAGQSRLRIGAKANDMRLAEHGTASIELKSFFKHLVGSSIADQPQLLNQSNDQERLLHELFGAQAIGWLPIISQQSTRKANTECVAIILLWYQSEHRIEPDILAEKLADIAPVARVAIRYAKASPAGTITNSLIAPKRRSMLRRLANNSLARLGILVTLFVAACCIPVPLTLTAPATLVPARLQTIYAPASGTIDAVLVRYGQNVQADQPILRIKSADIENEYESLVAERLENEQRSRDIQLQLLRSNELTAQQRSSLEGEAQTLSVILRTQNERVALIEKQLASLEITAQEKGVVGTWKIDTMLHHKPVLLGQPLAMIYDPEAEWGFEIELAEKDLGAFITHMANTHSPKLRCRLDSAPLNYIDVQVQSDYRQIVLHRNSDGAAIAPIYASVDPKLVSQLTPGASGTVELTVGKQPIAWVLTRDFVLNAWAKLRLWI
jgi:hypothetical protein